MDRPRAADGRQRRLLSDAADPTVDAKLAGTLARCTFPPPATRLTCAVSGGPDSLALLVLARAAGCDVEAVHVDHGLRPGSASESAVVEAAARGLGARFRAERVEVEPGPNLEARARAARYEVLPADVATGHTADDLAETVVLNLVRGAGLWGAASLLGPGGAGRRRPLLGLRRTDTEAVCAVVGLEPVRDPSNDDARFRRNRVRHEVLPLLDDVAARDTVPLLGRHATWCAEAAAFVDEHAAALDVTDADALAAAPRIVAAAAVRRWLGAADAERHPPDAATIDRVLAVAAGERRATEVGGGRRVARTARRLRLEPPTP
ncbi:MAG: tRNA lysidine(34) synthetase TilS [Actinomycetota bacterium]|nr:tRNA lysidine(34) synthetase TilS [Actinomycetota bacterium]